MKWNEMTKRAENWDFQAGDPSIWRYEDGTPVDTLPLGDGPKFAAIRDDMRLKLYENNDPNGREVVYIMTEGGSSVSAITGNNEYESTHHHYMKKIGVDDAVSAANKEDVFFRGHVEEEPTAKFFVKIMKDEYNMDVELENDTFMYGNQKYPGARVNLDRRIRSIDGKLVNGGLEIKTAAPFSPHADLFKKGILPAAYEDQVRFYMAVMNIDWFYVIGRWGLELSDCSIILVKRDLEIEKHLMGAYMEFYDCVQNGIEPTENSQDVTLLIKDYIKLHGVPNKTVASVELPETAKTVLEEAVSLDEELTKLDKMVKEIKERKQEILSALLPYMTVDGEIASYASCQLDDDTAAGVTVKQSYHRDSFNAELLKEKEPALYDAYKLESVDVTKLKTKAKTVKFTKEHPEFNINDFIIPGEPLSDVPKLEIKIKRRPKVS